MGNTTPIKASLLAGRMLTSTLAVVRAAGRHVSKQGKLSHRRTQEVFQDTPKGLAKSLQPQWERRSAQPTGAQGTAGVSPPASGLAHPQRDKLGCSEAPWRHSSGLIPREMQGILIVLARWGPWQGSGCRQWFWSRGSGWKTPAPCSPVAALVVSDQVPSPPLVRMGRRNITKT